MPAVYTCREWLVVLERNAVSQGAMKQEEVASPYLEVVSKKSDATWTSLNGLSEAAHER